MKTKFLAGLIATLVALVFVVGISVFLALVLEIDASKNWFTYTAAFLTIAVWTGMYSWLKPKEQSESQEQDNDLPPAREV
ncbi:hypothetical protein K6119_16540 [Paracrocinitomix mangrovi]|uniref:hypothetical protein n=1 Tax=Paracrocinitomix mangrovi TaxID=2862509 RepID=UPI001C8DB8AD|nr:hypothetical protein [Paracrocinitomix mangrovi]UKN01337.1 hypothetical protein K6119_16540 [Paracrocinitomix mangrovi]